eukprot:3250603-Pleurochrysis_carterae.AAC.1
MKTLAEHVSPEVGVGTRVLMPERADGGLRSGVVFAAADGRVLLCYDDKLWESHTMEHIRQHGKLLVGADAEQNDLDAQHIAAVLLSKNVNSISAPSGFLYGHSSEASQNNWEAYRRLGLPPTGSNDFSIDLSRCGTPCLAKEVCVGDLITLGKEKKFVHAITCSVAAGGTLTHSTPCTAW